MLSDFLLWLENICYVFFLGKGYNKFWNLNLILLSLYDKICFN